jgi:hypothetical protein
LIAGVRARNQTFSVSRLSSAPRRKRAAKDSRLCPSNVPIADYDSTISRAAHAQATRAPQLARQCEVTQQARESLA